VRLAVTGHQHRHRRLIGVQHAALLHALPERIGRDGPQCLAPLRRTRLSLWHRVVLAAARQLPNLCGADRAGTFSAAAAALRIGFVLYKTTVKRHFVQRHQGLGQAKVAWAMQRRSESFGKACWINQ